MEYAFNIENFCKIISAESVPHDTDGLSFLLEDTNITIKKPYTDLQGEEMGNSVEINNNKGLLLSITVMKNYVSKTNQPQSLNFSLQKHDNRKLKQRPKINQTHF